MRDLTAGLIVTAVGTGIVGAIGLLLVDLEPALIRPVPRAPRPPDLPPPIAPSVTPSGPVRMTDQDLAPEPGGRYLAAVKVSGFLVRALANPTRVRQEAEKQGFRDVLVTKGAPPPGSPPVSPADYFVLATYAGAPRSIARSQGGGAVQIVDAWRVS